MTDGSETFLDSAAQRHAPANQQVRLLSLAPALTELCFALELNDRLVGRTEFCRRPEGKLAQIPAVGTPEILQLDRIERLAPTHALVNLDDTPKSLISALKERGIDVVSVRLTRPDDNFWLFGLLAGIFGAGPSADALARRFEAALARVKMAVRRRQVRRVLYLVDKNPYRTAGPDSYAASLLKLVNLQVIAGAVETEPSLAPSGRRYPVIEIGDSLLLSVDAVLLSGAPDAFSRADRRAFVEAYGLDRDKVLRLEDAMDGWYGARAIGALEDLLSLRERIDSLD